MKFNINLHNVPEDTFRVSSLRGVYDIQDKKFHQTFIGEIPIEDVEWNIGLIVGSSGSGKSTISKQCFGEFTEFKYSKPSLIDDFESALSPGEIFELLSSVGFSSPPFWMKPYSVLSNGEKMRVDLARAISSNVSPIIFDEFTSVVDRQIAQIGSLAIQKYIRKNRKQFIAVSCHRDIIDWLCPDWVYDTDEQKFFFVKNFHLSSLSQSTNASNLFGENLVSIII